MSEDTNNERKPLREAEAAAEGLETMRRINQRLERPQVKAWLEGRGFKDSPRLEGLIDDILICEEVTIESHKREKEAKKEAAAEGGFADVLARFIEGDTRTDEEIRQANLSWRETVRRMAGFGREEVRSDRYDSIFIEEPEESPQDPSQP